MQSTTAILFFSRTATAEHRAKRILRSQRYNRRLLRALIQRSRSTLKRSALPVYHFSEAEQRGHSFGERIAHATAAVFACGYTSVIIVGNDCPQLRATCLQRAADQLQRGQAIIGPDTDGGAYLIGLTRAQFSVESFARLPWQTDKLAAALGRYLSEPAYLMASLTGINALPNLLSLWRYLRTLPMFRLLVMRVVQVQIDNWPTIASSAARCCRWHPHRGPPTFC